MHVPGVCYGQQDRCSEEQCSHQRLCWQLSQGSLSAWGVLNTGGSVVASPGGGFTTGARRLQPPLSQEIPAVPYFWEGSCLYSACARLLGFLVLASPGAWMCAALLAQPPALCLCAHGCA